MCWHICTIRWGTWKKRINYWPLMEELKISHTFRRLTMIAQRFGDADHHLERYASLG